MIPWTMTLTELELTAICRVFGEVTAQDGQEVLWVRKVVDGKSTRKMQG